MSLTQIQATDIQSSANISVAGLYTTGPVGVGTSTPRYNLDVVSTANTIGRFYWNDGTYNPRLQITGSSAGISLIQTYTTGAGNLIFGTAGSETMRIDASGFFGINTGANTNPIGGNTNARNLAVSGDGTLNSADGRLVLINPQPYANQTVGTTTAGRIYFSLPNASGGTTTSAAFIDALTAGSGGTGGYGLSLRFHPKADNSTDFFGATLDYNGNFGLGVTPSPWGGVHAGRVFQTGGAAFYGRNDNSDAYMGTNFYRDSTNTWRYLTTAAANYQQLSGGAFYWYTASSNTAGNPIAFSQVMNLDGSGNLLVGASSSSGSTTNTAAVVGGAFHTASGTASVPTATATQFTTISQAGLYLAQIYIPTYQTNAWSAWALIGWTGSGGQVAYVMASNANTGSTWSTCSITVNSSTTTPGILVTQNGGSTFTMPWSITRLA